MHEEKKEGSGGGSESNHSPKTGGQKVSNVLQIFWMITLSVSANYWLNFWRRWFFLLIFLLHFFWLSKGMKWNVWQPWMIWRSSWIHFRVPFSRNISQQKSGYPASMFALVFLAGKGKTKNTYYISSVPWVKGTTSATKKASWEIFLPIMPGRIGCNNSIHEWCPSGKQSYASALNKTSYNAITWAWWVTKILGLLLFSAWRTR